MYTALFTIQIVSKAALQRQQENNATKFVSRRKSSVMVHFCCKKVINLVGSCHKNGASDNRERQCKMHNGFVLNFLTKVLHLKGYSTFWGNRLILPLPQS